MPDLMLRAALAYAEKFHLLVFPLFEISDGKCSCPQGAQCGSAGKHPRVPTGFKAASLDAAQIRKWWTRWPTANVGINTGASGLVVLDIDPRNGGDDSLVAIEQQHGALPHTVRGLTGGGGQHYLFARPDNVDHLRGKPIAPGVDVKADGGYIVAAPSTHLSGRAYVWDVGAHPTETTIAPLPSWLLAQLDTTPHNGSNGQATNLGFLGAAFEAAGWLGRAIAPDKSAAQCPWEAEHTSGTRYDSSTIVYGPAPGKSIGWFFCAHEHCRGRTLKDVFSVLPDDAKQAARAAATADEPPDTSEDWQRSLVCTESGKLTRAPGNAALLLMHTQDWRGVLGYNEFASQIEATRPLPPLDGFDAPLPGELRDDHLSYIQHWLDRHRGVLWGIDAITSAVALAARARTFHPLRQYLDSLTWDGQPRVNAWLTTYLGAEDSTYARAVGQWWLISAVARAYESGCQADHVLILEGAQGLGKSSAIRILAGPWYSGSLSDVRDKDAYDRLAGHWIVEISELDAFRGASASRIKDFVSQVIDIYRPAYARCRIRRPRSCVFVGTTNDASYLHDSTGARRFWPVAVTRLDRDALVRDRDHLWAEAVELYRDGREWWPTRELASDIATAQERRFDLDPWEELISDWLPSQSADLTIKNLLHDCLSLDPRDQTPIAAGRIARVLRRLGWRPLTVRIADKTARRWVCR